MVCIAIAYFNIFSENGFNIFVKVNAWRSVAFVFVNTIINTIKIFVLSWCMKPRNQRHVSDETQSKQNQRNSWSRLKVTNPVNHYMHTNQIYLADLALVQSSIVGQFQLPKHYILLHPVGTGTRGVRVEIDTAVWKQEDISYMLHAHTDHFLSW